MMRDQIVACLVACLLLAAAGMAVTAQDETPDAQRVELPDAGIAIAFPAGWDVEARSEPGEYQLPLEFADQSTLEIATVPYRKVLWASDPGSGMNFCSVDMYEEMPMSPARHAEQTLRRLSEVDPESVATPVRLSAGDAVRVDTEWGGAVRANYYLDVDGQRFSLHCTAGTRPQDDWLSIAETIEILDAPPTHETEPVGTVAPMAGRQRVEIADTTIALSFPSDWTVESVDQEREFDLPPDYDWASAVTTHTRLAGYPEGPASCFLMTYVSNGLYVQIGLDDLAGILVQRLERPDEGWTSQAVPVRLPAGDAYRVDTEDEAGGAHYTSYLFASDNSYHQLTCSDDARAEDDWLSIASTIESSDGGAHAGQIVDMYSVADFSSVIPVSNTSLSDALDGSVMSADCTQATWIEYEDGTFEERLECTLSDDRVDPPEWQGTRPTEWLTFAGGECEWTSDFWSVTDGSDVYALSYQVTVSPTGQVSGSSTYGAELLECTEE